MILLKLNESNASLRVVPLPSLISASRGTSAATNESGRTFYFSIGGVDYGSGGSISAISAEMGMYTCNFAASKISVTGPGMVYYGGPNSSGTALPVSAPFMVVPFDSYDSMRLGLFALPNAAAEASGGLITHGTGTGQLHTSNGSVGIKAQTHSGVTIKGIENYANISSVTLNAGTHSGATIQGLSNSATQVSIAAGDYSGVTVQGLSNKTFFQTSVQSSVWSGKRSDWTTPGSFGEYVYSQVTGTSTGTVQGVTRALSVNEVSLATLAPGTHSGATIQGVTRLNSSVTLNAGNHSGATIDGVLFIGTAGARSLASSYLSTDLGNARYVQQAYEVLRNRVQISGSTMTVYQTDDTTSSWTASVTTGTNTVTQIDPGGA